MLLRKNLRDLAKSYMQPSKCHCLKDEKKVNPFSEDISQIKEDSYFDELESIYWKLQTRLPAQYAINSFEEYFLNQCIHFKQKENKQ